MIEHIVAPLFVPADRPERFQKAALSGADAIILDLEDAVAHDEKEKSRSNLRSDFSSIPVIVRVNGVDTPFHHQDIEAATRCGAAAIMVPKASTSAAFVSSARRTSLPIIALVETAEGITQARELRHIASIKRLAFGSVDFCADIGCSHTRDALLSARSELVLASRLGRLAPPIDGVTIQLDGDEVCVDDAEYARKLGFGAKLCIHPRQIAGVMRGFKPSEKEITWAKRVVTTPDGVGTVDGMMVDEPVRKRASAILARAQDHA